MWYEATIRQNTKFPCKPNIVSELEIMAIYEVHSQMSQSEGFKIMSNKSIRSIQCKR